ncbi:Uncharacterized protein FKW44_010811 [Caligus rogercresseyi]|uniref:THAP-type domain-containing protein n=1 Tax=Caligus rogercresseyi TaxID=217165 RepID=A0A7T8K8E9_CALRO|nr:Uncharacterized protein FKW44_010811 [Caligus rogercresseyi]
MPCSRGSNRVCAIPSCPNPRDAQYFSFPTKNLDIQRQWIARCRRSDRIGLKHAKICDRHFTPDDFQRNLQAELLGISARKKLKAQAVPSLLIPGSPSSSVSSKSLRQVRQEAREQKQIVNRLLKGNEAQELELKTSHEVIEPQEDPLVQTVPTQADVYKLEKGIQYEESKGIIFMQRKYKKLEKEFSLTKNETALL